MGQRDPCICVCVHEHFLTSSPNSKLCCYDQRVSTSLENYIHHILAWFHFKKSFENLTLSLFMFCLVLAAAYVVGRTVEEIPKGVAGGMDHIGD